MKRIVCSLFLAFSAITLFAQGGEMYSLLFHGEWDDRYGIIGPHGFMRQRDGDFVINAYLVDNLANDDECFLGNLLYKVSSNTLAITDTLYVADTTSTEYFQRSFLLAQDPRGEGNIRANFEYHEECDNSFLRISHYPDSDFNVITEEDVVVPVCEGRVEGGRGMLNIRGDLIMKYSKYHPGGATHEYDSYIICVDREGTLKYHRLMFEDEGREFLYPTLGMLSESPLQYYQWRQIEGHVNQHAVYNVGLLTIDSLLNVNTVILGSVLSEEVLDPENPFWVEYERLNLNRDANLIPIGGNKILVAAQYENDTNFYGATEYGVAVAKYDIRTMQLQDYIVFNDLPGGYGNQAECRGIKMMSDGTVYFIYSEQDEPDETLTVVKMDTDLNVYWKRYFKTENVIIWGLSYPIIYKDEQGEEKGIIWTGYGTKNGQQEGILCFLLYHDGTVSTNENGMAIRPYMFYPNPAQDQLHLQYSPDVQPKQIELYDLQGRLMRSQGNAFETFDLGSLPTGTYTLRVTMEDGQVFSDKVVKE